MAEVADQECNKCNKLLPLTTRYFHWRKDSSSFRKVCKECYNSKRRNAIVGNVTKELGEYISEIKCTKCGTLLLRTKEFFETREDGFRRSCRECGKKYYHENKERISGHQRKYYQNNRHQILEHQKEYAANNIEAIKEKSRNRYYNNKDKYREINRKSRIKHKDKRNKTQRAYESKRRTEDLAYRLRRNVSRCVNSALKRMGSSKRGGSIIIALPYSIEELVCHLESLFESWMNWDNYGKYKVKEWDDDNQSTWTWQIDHIIPQSKLIYNNMEHPNFFKCWELVNLRPLSSKRNLLDGVNRVRH